MVLLLVLAGVGGYFYMLNQTKGVQEVETLRTLSVTHVEALELKKEGLPLVVTLEAKQCPREVIYAALIPHNESSDRLSFQCHPDGRESDIDPNSIRKVQFLWSPRPSALQTTESTIREERTLWVEPMRDRGQTVSVSLVIDAKYSEKKKGLFVPALTYSNPQLRGESAKAWTPPKEQPKPSQSDEDSDAIDREISPEEI